VRVRVKQTRPGSGVNANSRAGKMEMRCVDIERQWAVSAYTGPMRVGGSLDRVYKIKKCKSESFESFKTIVFRPNRSMSARTSSSSSSGPVLAAPHKAPLERGRMRGRSGIAPAPDETALVDVPAEEPASAAVRRPRSVPVPVGSSGLRNAYERYEPVPRPDASDVGVPAPGGTLALRGLARDDDMLCYPPPMLHPFCIYLYSLHLL